MSDPTAELASIIRDVQNARFATLSASVIIVFDHLITLDQEIELIWRSSWSNGKLLFFLNRYYPLFTVIFNLYALFNTHLTSNLCLSWLQWQGWSGFVAIIVAELILQLRIYALYSLNKKVMIFMASFFLMSMAAAGTIMGLVLSSISATPHTIAWLEFCMPANVPRYLYAYWIPILTFESLLCGMAIMRGVKAFRDQESSFISGTQLITILLRDSIIYFIIVFLTYLTNLLLWSTGAIGLIEVPVGFTMAMSSVMGSRLVLNVRFMKRELELGIQDRHRDILHIPFHSQPSIQPSPVMFAGHETGYSDAEYIEMHDVSSKESGVVSYGH